MMDTFWELLLALSALIFIVGSCLLHSNALRFMEIADKLFALTDQRMSLLEDQVDDLQDRLLALEHPPLSRDGDAVAYVVSAELAEQLKQQEQKDRDDYSLLYSYLVPAGDVPNEA